MTDTIPSGIRLKNLIQNHHAEILSREKNNKKFIHLYSIGTYWVAFERSACRLNGLFPHCELSLFMVPGCADYIVMASIFGDEAAAYMHKHIVWRDDSDYQVLSVSSFPVRDYYRWHVDTVKSVLQR